VGLQRNGGAESSLWAFGGILGSDGYRHRNLLRAEWENSGAVYVRVEALRDGAKAK
jgi:hypothetical protein